MWSKQSLMERRDGANILDDDGEIIGHEAGIGSACFNQEYRNIPLNRANSVVQQSWIKYYDYQVNFDRLIVDYDYIVMAIDPATSTKESRTGDSSGISIIGLKGVNYYVLYSKGHKLSSLDLVEECCSLYIRYKPNMVIFEKNKEETIGQLLMQRSLPVIMEHAIKDKMTRLLAQQYKFQNGQVFFPDDGSCEEAIYQVTNFPDIVHDDIMDSLIYCLTVDSYKNKSKINTSKQRTIAGNITIKSF
jgi:predicted phage terminase large subunit-like protein